MNNNLAESLRPPKRGGRSGQHEEQRGPPTPRGDSEDQASARRLRSTLRPPPPHWCRGVAAGVCRRRAGGKNGQRVSCSCPVPQLGYSTAVLEKIY